MALVIDTMDGHGLSNKARRERLPRKGGAILVVRYSRKLLVWKLGTRRSASVYGGEWAYCTRSKAFKDKARLQLQSKISV